jgi:gliding motility-associatede transport system auxiliary component
VRRFARLRRWFASRRGRALTALACIALMLVAGNVVVTRWVTKRYDLTAERLYTLATGTRHILGKLDEPITLRLYYSTRLGESVPAYGVYAARVRELLDQYVAAAHGKIRLEIYNPLPFSDAEDRAVSFGLQAAPLNDRGEAVYFGLAAANSTDDQQVIAFFNPERERFLEYDLTRLVRSLAFPKRTVIGLMTALPLEGNPAATLPGRAARPMAIIDQLQQVDDVEALPLQLDAIPAKIDVLMLVHPQNLPETTQFAIDQFVLKGGKALVFVDPYSELESSLQSPQSGAPAGSDLGRLLHAWGVRLMPGIVAGDRTDARRVSVPVPGRGAQAMDYVSWLALPAANLDRDDPITADLHQIAMASAGILEPIPDSSTKLQPLIRTSPDSMRIPLDKVKGLPDVAGLLAAFKPDGQTYTLAARVTGTAQTAFPGGRPAAAGKPPAEPAPADFVKQSTQPLNLIVVADSDMLDDRFWAQSRDFFGRQVVVPVANNGDFVANAVEVLAGGADLVGLRSRGTAARRFVVVEQLQREADQRYAAEQQSLQKKLKDAQAKLHTLTAGEGAGAGNPAASTLSADQAKDIDTFRAQMVQTRQKLRAVQAALRENIDRLKVILEFIDIALIPIVIMAGAVVLAALRRRPRRPAV